MLGVCGHVSFMERYISWPVLSWERGKATSPLFLNIALGLGPIRIALA